MRKSLTRKKIKKRKGTDHKENDQGQDLEKEEADTIKIGGKGLDLEIDTTVTVMTEKSDIMTLEDNMTDLGLPLLMF